MAFRSPNAPAAVVSRVKQGKIVEFNYAISVHFSSASAPAIPRITSTGVINKLLTSSITAQL